VKYFSFLLALGLFLSGWKARILQINLRLLFSPSSSPTPRFSRFLWYRHLAQALCESLRGRTAGRIHLRPQDASKFQVLRSQPTLFLTAHFNNWEALAGWMTRQGIPLLGAARPLRSPLFDTLLARLRGRHGVPVVTRDILPRALAHLRAGRCFGILWDQYSPLHRHSSPFFGRPAAMDPLPEILVRRIRPAVMAGFLLPDGTWRLMQLMPAGTPLPDPARLSRRFHRALEAVVRAHPTYWFGLCHARFKDTVTYPGRRKVSRETLAPKPFSSQKVSRETSTPVSS
jgi:lauroyl/myristoyl acyltransferase